MGSGPGTEVGARFVTSKDGTRIAFDRAGDGPPLVLVSGALSQRATSAPWVEPLARTFTVFTYDRRGRGDSGDKAPYAVAREVEDLDALIQEAGGSAFVAGFSSGAVLALGGAAGGLAIRKLALYEPPFIVDTSRPLPPADLQAQIEALVAAGRRGDAVELFFTKAVGMPPDAVAQTRQAPMWSALEALAHTLPYDIAVLGDTMQGRPLPADRWAGAKIPTLVMVGGASPDWARTAVRSAAAILPDARHEVLEGQTHSVDPTVLAPVLERFFAG